MGKHRRKQFFQVKREAVPEGQRLEMSDSIFTTDYEIVVTANMGARCLVCGAREGEYIFAFGEGPGKPTTMENRKTLDLCQTCWNRFLELGNRLWLRIRAGKHKIATGMVPVDVAEKLLKDRAVQQVDWSE